MKSLVILIILGVFSAQIQAQENQTFQNEDEEYIDNLSESIGDIKLILDTLYEDYYVIRGEGVAGNIGIYVGESGVYMIDNQWSALSERLKEMIASITEKPIKLIINSHFHFDHTNGNLAFGRDGIPILAHNKARERMQRRQVLHGHDSEVQNPYPSDALPTLTFEDKMVLHDGQETIELKYFPNAHTDGDIIVHFEKADIYHMGDIFVTYGIPVIDPDGGGDIYALIETIDYTIANSKSTSIFIPGHGQVCSKKELIVFSELLHVILDSVEESVKKGENLEQTILDTKRNIGEDVGGINKDKFITLVHQMVIKRNK